MYAQKVDDAAENRSLGGVPSAEITARVRINILPYQDISSFSASEARAFSESSFVVRTRHILTGEEEGRSYDAIIMGTGYERQSWMRLFEPSDRKDVVSLGEVFGLTPRAPVQLHPTIEKTASKTSTSLSKLDVSGVISNKAQAEQPLTPPPTPSPTGSAGRPFADHAPPSSVRITRAYRLLPVEQHADFAARVYVQGCAESSHGLSDTLLSVLGPRSGEVVTDMLSA